ncbi:protein-tyrosine sulfotransferase 2-like isoform X2 [Anolis carolinensis]|uniref:protein-tyrosine sulfotransferase 2-like isoform X2 n=1 Tax=Anolis carolinensis TaxID=28377 RepID=UPI002F2B305A
MRLTVRRLLVVVVLVGALFLSAHWLLGCRPLDQPFVRRPEYGREAPLLFIGGVPRSGARTLSALLDLPCRPETHVVPRLLAMRQAWSKSAREKLRLDQAGVTAEVLDAALAAFVLQVLAPQGDPDEEEVVHVQEEGFRTQEEVVHVQDEGFRTQEEVIHVWQHQLLCNHDPFALRSAAHLARIFPNSRILKETRLFFSNDFQMQNRETEDRKFAKNVYILQICLIQAYCLFSVLFILPNIIFFVYYLFIFIISLLPKSMEFYSSLKKSNKIKFFY